MADVKALRAMLERASRDVQGIAWLHQDSYPLLTAALAALPELLDAYDQNERGQFDLLAEMQRRDDALDEVERLRAALEIFRVWADGFANPTQGMGAGLHAEMWPLLPPSAYRKMLEIVAAALADTKEESTDG